MHAMLKSIVLCFSLACMGTPVSMHSCRVCGCVVVPVCLCMRYGLDTGTCVHSSTARGHISKNRLNPTGVCVLSSIFSALWPRLEGLEVESCWTEDGVREIVSPACKKNTQHHIRPTMYRHCCR